MSISGFRQILKLYVNVVKGQKCEFSMLEKTTVKGELRGCDRDVLNLAVANLETPMGKIPEAVLRTGDIISVKVPNVPFSLENAK